MLTIVNNKNGADLIWGRFDKGRFDLGPVWLWADLVWGRFDLLPKEEWLSTVPCGTPGSTDSSREDSLSTTFIYLSQRTDLAQSSSDPIMPQISSLFKKLSCGTVSKALLKSNMIPSVGTVSKTLLKSNMIPSVRTVSKSLLKSNMIPSVRTVSKALLKYNMIPSVRTVPKA